VGIALSDTYADVASLTYFFWFARVEGIFGRERRKKTHFGELGGLLGLWEQLLLPLCISFLFHSSICKCVLFMS